MATQQKFEKLDFKFTPKDEYLDEDFRQKAVKALESEKTRGEAAEKLGVSVAVLTLAARVEDEGLIPFRNQNELAQKVVKARQAGDGWAVIGARLGGMTESRVQALYEQGAEESYEKADIGRGGRPKGTGGGGGSKSKTKAKSSSKKSSSKSKSKTKAKSSGRPFENPDPDGGDDDEIRDAIEGHVVTVERPGGKTADVEVVKVDEFLNSKSGNRGVKVTDTDSKSKTFGVAKIIDINELED